MNSHHDYKARLQEQQHIQSLRREVLKNYRKVFQENQKIIFKLISQIQWRLNGNDRLYIHHSLKEIRETRGIIEQWILIRQLRKMNIPITPLRCW
jgi:hypothetical protein